MSTLIIKSGTTSIEGAIVKGSFSYFSGSTKDLGPTSTTGFYSGIDAPSGGYTVYQIGNPNGWTARVATDDSSLNSILIGVGATGSTLSERITWATNTNSVFINSGATLVTYTIGQQALGGTIAYILQSGDPGYDANVQHGFVSAINANPTSRLWGCFQTVEILGAAVSEGSIGDGYAATTQINTQCSDRPIAASVATATTAGYDDWYLPSKDELNKLYLNKVAIGYNTTARYWSSTQNNNSLGTAWAQIFSTGAQLSTGKNQNSRVIPIRSF